MITDTCARALRIIADYCDESPHLLGIYATAFARRMWPDSLAWRRSYNCGGYGSHRGTGIVLSAGSYLAKLYRRGLTWINHSDHHQRFHSLRQAGRDALAEWEAANEEQGD